MVLRPRRAVVMMMSSLLSTPGVVSSYICERVNSNQVEHLDFNFAESKYTLHKPHIRAPFTASHFVSSSVRHRHHDDVQQEPRNRNSRHLHQPWPQAVQNQRKYLWRLHRVRAAYTFPDSFTPTSPNQHPTS